MQRAKRGKLTLNTFFPISQYMGAAVVALVYPQLNETTYLLPGVNGPRAWMMLWVAALLGLSVLMDRAYLRAYRRDLWEIENKVKNGNMNRSTLLALGVPLMLIVDAVAIAHLYLSYFKGGANPQGESPLMMHTACMAVGIVLWAYGRSLLKIPHKSIWGIRTKDTMADQMAWARAHLKAMPWTCASGLAALTAGTFLTAEAAIAPAALCCIVACAAMLLAAKRSAK